MIIRMYSDILFDREIINRHYISPGVHVIQDKDGNRLKFDFENFHRWVDEDDKCLLHVEQWNLDTNIFPNSINLLEFLENFDTFVEFFVFTGEWDDPKIIPLKVMNVIFCDYSNGKGYVIPDECLEDALCY